MTVLASLIPGLKDTLIIGPMARQGRLGIQPVFWREPNGAEKAVDHWLLDQALQHNLIEIEEISDHGSVPELKLLCRAEKPILLLDGEELVGAKQNRIVNVSILAPATGELRIPVSCVEQGRWAYRSKRFSTSKQAMFAQARSKKAYRMAMASRDIEDRGAGRFAAGQGEIWADVSDKLSRMKVASASAAMADFYEARDGDLDAMVETFPAEPDQIGALFWLDDRLSAIEILTKPGAFGIVFPKLVRSHGIDALEPIDTSDGPRAPTRSSIGSADAALAALADVAVRPTPSVGLGTDVRLMSDRLVGSALVHDGAIVHLAAFPSETVA